MSNVVRLFNGENNMLRSITDEYAKGEISDSDKAVFIHTKGNALEIGFIHSAMDAHAVIGLLEVAKLHVYRKFIAKD